MLPPILEPRSAKRLSRVVNPALGGAAAGGAVELGPEVATPCSYLAERREVLGLSILLIAAGPAAGPSAPAPPGSHLGREREIRR